MCFTVKRKWFFVWNTAENNFFFEVSNIPRCLVWGSVGVYVNSECVVSIGALHIDSDKLKCVHTKGELVIAREVESSWCGMCGVVQ